LTLFLLLEDGIGEDPDVALHEADDLGGFEVRLGAGVEIGPGLSLLDGAIRLGSADQAWIDRAWLRSFGGFDRDPDRARAFDAMVDYAAQHGWVDADGRIGAHVVAEDRRG
jgi:hypothetical protein